MTGHFAQRVKERIPGADPFELWQRLAPAIRAGDNNVVQFITRQDRKGRRVFAFQHPPGGKTYHVVANTRLMIPITVLDPIKECRK